MNMHKGIAGALTVVAAVATCGESVRAHHSFAMYDTSVTKVFTGVVSRVQPDANHMLMYFAPMNEARKGVEKNAKGEPLIWMIEMAGATQMAKMGVSVNSFPPGTVFSVALHPLRSGKPAGVREGGMFKCPDRMPPAPGKHCDSVAGHTSYGDAPLAKPTK